ncbi:geraniol 8-hydroxylase-like [Lotus japonicus]|uniref:geraniol 8-hydroxylase-like n=1 Tax=Lotus japonicus TaxID=34305 RepID=UPI002590818E|nr:geraniol 8-hydroxylase-like [Lotus japonicus]
MDMQLLTLLCASILTFFILRFLYNQTQNPTKIPPGPRPYPIIGNILELGKNPHIALSKLSKIYGPIMTLKLGTITTIVITSPKLAKQVLQENSQIFSSRTVPHSAQVYDNHKFSVGWLPPSAKWRNLRKVLATKVFSPAMLDSTKFLRQKKMKELLDFLKEKSMKGEALDLGEAVFSTVLNSISNTFFSMDFSHSTSDEKARDFKTTFWGVMKDAGKPNIADYFPILRGIDPQGIYARMGSYFVKLTSIIDGIIEERMCSRASKADSKVSNDILDSLLSEIEETNSQLTRKEIMHLFLSLLVAGIDTTSSTVEWAMAELLRNPDKLAKAKEELYEVIGKDATLEESHISKLPYLQAVVKETLRLHPQAPLLLPRKCDEAVNIAGFHVPKDAQVWVNVWAIGRDPTIWKNPNMFEPERFLECEINFKGNNFELIPFGAGKRICPGLPLAQRSVQFIVASLLHNFEWKLADGLTPEGMNMMEQFGLTLTKVEPLRVQAIPVKLG